ncbi:hypothetical protein ACWEQL_29875 [Kitasatospora sp. NPDC004240]
MHPTFAFTDPDALLARCEIASVRLTRDDPEYSEYARGSVVPAGPWQPLPEGLLDHLAPSVFTQDNRLVELFDPDRVADLSGAVRLGSRTSPPDALTTTVDPDSGRRPGLHVDGYQQLRYDEMAKARRLLCVNEGPGARYLLLADTDIRAICRTVQARYETHHPCTNDVGLFVSTHKPLRVLRLRVEPGEAFLVPTALLPHDGSTEGLEKESTVTCWLGHWERGEFGSLL